VRRSAHGPSETATECRLARAMRGGRVPGWSIPPDVALPLLTPADNRPEEPRPIPELWDGHELAPQLVAEAVVPGTSVEIVRRTLQDHRLNPWRSHHPDLPQSLPGMRRLRQSRKSATRTRGRPPARWPCAATGNQGVAAPREVADLVGRAPESGPRRARTPTPQGTEPFVGFDTRTGRVAGRSGEQERHVELVELVERRHRGIPAAITTLRVMWDDCVMPEGHQVRA
jgi:hypothetical protein